MVIGSRNSKCSILGFVLLNRSVLREVQSGPEERSRDSASRRGEATGQNRESVGLVSKGQTPRLSPESIRSGLLRDMIPAIGCLFFFFPWILKLSFSVLSFPSERKLAEILLILRKIIPLTPKRSPSTRVLRILSCILPHRPTKLFLPRSPVM